eukprot:1375114-Amphidinium_carterae.1
MSGRDGAVQTHEILETVVPRLEPFGEVSTTQDGRCQRGVWKGTVRTPLLTYEVMKCRACSVLAENPNLSLQRALLQQI